MVLLNSGVGTRPPLHERVAFVACEPGKTFCQRDNRIRSASFVRIALVHYAEHRKRLHFFSRRWWRAPEQIYYVEKRNGGDRKSTRLNSSHTVISYAVFCLKKKKKCKNI